jgi:hypothetical protein
MCNMFPLEEMWFQDPPQFKEAYPSDFCCHTAWRQKRKDGGYKE